MATVRFYRGELLLGVTEIEPDTPLLDLAEAIGVEIPRNCTSGNCGTCMCRIKSGSVSMPVNKLFGKAFASAIDTRPEPQQKSSTAPPVVKRSCVVGQVASQ